MLKFVKHTMETIDGIAIFPIISFIIFFGFFVGLLIWVFRTDKSYINYIEQLPFKEDK
ncbi:MAG: CcoQ/FixQ family Cbb3-type cytochrome c oxidase assembly chaperone [Flavobacteriales bacterium]|nr:CcoQ/FixQ family Cbb3-type cytochrome c oxidase assembly chaperone [Flavobacteriales bacterium]